MRSEVTSVQKIQEVSALLTIPHSRIIAGGTTFSPDIEEELHLKTEEYIISPIVGVCCGPGMYGCWFKGKLVTEKGAQK